MDNDEVKVEDTEATEEVFDGAEEETSLDEELDSEEESSEDESE